jgi:tetratricopeptide (TPR) repeat protein
LVDEGHESLRQGDPRTAKAHFLGALGIIRAEPALRDQELAVYGWLIHSVELAARDSWSQRRPPPLFDELRDEALVLCLLTGAGEEDRTTAARQAIQTALSLTIAEDPAWRQEREQLALLDADLVLRGGRPADALAILDQTEGIESRLLHHRRADCLERLGRKAEADRARANAAQLSPADALGFFLSGIDRLHGGNPAGAIDDFDRALSLEPNHFMARFCQAACFLRLNRLGEARVALTACLGQRPHFAWTCLLQAQVHLQANDALGALEDCRRGLALNPRDPARCALLVQRGFLHLQLESWDLARADFDQALALRPDEPEAERGRGLAALAR